MRRISSSPSQVDVRIIAELIERNKLGLIPTATAIYHGDCPFCGHPRTFTLWADKGVYRCFWCGCDGRFVQTPERTAATREAERKKLMGMVA